ncbi:MAG TPA: hypothetical protein EYQ64_12350 [Gemmatimonadetes bacterium]|nr:hypothetical protein [Gemmatimonadota bacterium]
MSTAPNYPAPRYIACRIDVSPYCQSDFLARCGGKVYLTGFFDDSVNTHLCSLTPSVYVHSLGFVPEAYPEGDEEREALDTELMEIQTTEDSDYYGRPTIERLRKAQPEDFKAVDVEIDREDSEEAWTDEVREHLSGNPVF